MTKLPAWHCTGSIDGTGFQGIKLAVATKHLLDTVAKNYFFVADAK